MKIDYQSKKWEKEIEKIISFKKEVKGNLFCNLELVCICQAKSVPIFN